MPVTICVGAENSENPPNVAGTNAAELSDRVPVPAALTAATRNMERVPLVSPLERSKPSPSVSPSVLKACGFDPIASSSPPVS